jgi:hypothetical protein
MGQQPWVRDKPQSHTIAPMRALYASFYMSRGALCHTSSTHLNVGLNSCASVPSQTSELMQHACYTEAAIMPCVRDINTLHKNAAANNLQAVRKKYAQEKHGSVSGIPPASF